MITNKLTAGGGANMRHTPVSHFIKYHNGQPLNILLPDHILSRSPSRNHWMLLILGRHKIKPFTLVPHSRHTLPNNFRNSPDPNRY